MILRKYGAATTVVFPLVDAGAVDFEATPVTFVAADTQIMKDEGAFANVGVNPAHEGNGFYSLALTAVQMQAGRIAISCIDGTATKLWEDQAVLIETYGHASAQHALDLDNSTVDADVREWLGAAVIAATGGSPPADIERVRGTVPNILTGGRWPVDVERWQAGTPNGVNNGAIEADVQRWRDSVVNTLQSGRVDAFVGAFAALVIDAAALAVDGAVKYADELLKRPISNVESIGNFRSLYGVVASLVNRRRFHPSTGALEVYETDDATVVESFTRTQDAAGQPTKELDP